MGLLGEDHLPPPTRKPWGWWYTRLLPLLQTTTWFSAFSLRGCPISLSLCLTWPRGGAEESLSSAWTGKPGRPLTSRPSVAGGLVCWARGPWKGTEYLSARGGGWFTPSLKILCQEQDRSQLHMEEMKWEHCGEHACKLWRLWDLLCVWF